MPDASGPSAGIASEPTDRPPAPVAFAALTVDKNVPIEVRDGTTLRADVFRPSDGGRYPVIMTYGPYGKDIHWQDFNPDSYELLDERGPYMVWETARLDGLRRRDQEGDPRLGECRARRGRGLVLGGGRHSCSRASA